MITVGSVVALVAFGLVVARVGWRAVLRYRGARHVRLLVGPDAVDPTIDFCNPGRRPGGGVLSVETRAKP